MFSGIVREFGLVVANESRGQLGRELEIESPLFSTSEFPLGSSIAVNGVCLTVMSRRSPQRLAFELGAETVRRTALGEIKENSVVNLESALRIGDPLDGHFVLGHVDGIGQLRSAERDGLSLVLQFSFPTQLAALIAEQGSVTVNGVGLTVVTVSEDAFSVSIVPHTAQHTNLALLSVGEAVNIEVDCLARYVSRLRDVKDPMQEIRNLGGYPFVGNPEISN